MANSKQKNQNGVILTAQPAKTRLFFMWAELVIIVAGLLIFWCLLETNFSKLLVAIVVVFLSVFTIIGALLTFLYIKHNVFYFTKKEIIAKAGISEVFENKINYKDIALYKKYTALPDLLTKKATANFIIYKIVDKKNGKRQLKEDRICSMHGIKNHLQISEILDQNNVQKLEHHKQISQIKKELKSQWKKIKTSQK